jgi:hypothetical protein
MYLLEKLGQRIRGRDPHHSGCLEAVMANPAAYGHDCQPLMMQRESRLQPLPQN